MIVRMPIAVKGTKGRNAASCLSCLSFWGARHGQVDRTMPGFSAQQLECVSPAVLEESWDAPERAERLDHARGLRRAHVGALPAELIDDPRDDRFRGRIVAAIEHRPRSAGK